MKFDIIFSKKKKEIWHYIEIANPSKNNWRLNQQSDNIIWIISNIGLFYYEIWHYTEILLTHQKIIED